MKYSLLPAAVAILAACSSSSDHSGERRFVAARGITIELPPESIVEDHLRDGANPMAEDVWRIQVSEDEAHTNAFFLERLSNTGWQPHVLLTEPLSSETAWEKPATENRKYILVIEHIAPGRIEIRLSPAL